MNDKQRTFLIDEIKSKYKRERGLLEKDKPEPPSLNNYLIAAALDGSLEFQPVDVLRARLHDKVLTLKPGDNLLSKDWDVREKGKIFFDPAEIFVLPQNYLDALAAYKVAREEWQRRDDALTQLKETLVLKIQLGSNAVLDKLIEQADNLADLNLVNTRLILSPATEQIESKKVHELKA